jgi:hypothetical protein
MWESLIDFVNASKDGVNFINYYLTQFFEEPYSKKNTSFYGFMCTYFFSLIQLCVLSLFDFFFYELNGSIAWIDWILFFQLGCGLKGAYGA